MGDVYRDSLNDEDLGELDDSEILEKARGESLLPARKLPESQRSGMHSPAAHRQTARPRRSTLVSPTGPVDFGMSLSPDGWWLVYAQIDDLGSDIVMLENLR